MKPSDLYFLFIPEDILRDFEQTDISKDRDRICYVIGYVLNKILSEFEIKKR
jgi:hypothetical protein